MCCISWHDFHPHAAKCSNALLPPSLLFYPSVSQPTNPRTAQTSDLCSRSLFFHLPCLLPFSLSLALNADSRPPSRASQLSRPRRPFAAVSPRLYISRLRLDFENFLSRSDHTHSLKHPNTSNHHRQYHLHRRTGAQTLPSTTALLSLSSFLRNSRVEPLQR